MWNLFFSTTAWEIGWQIQQEMEDLEAVWPLLWAPESTKENPIAELQLQVKPDNTNNIQVKNLCLLATEAEGEKGGDKTSWLRWKAETR